MTLHPDEKVPLPTTTNGDLPLRQMRTRCISVIAVICTLGLWHLNFYSNIQARISQLVYHRHQPINPYASIDRYCSEVSPISATEFQQRQEKLNSVLLESNSVYIAEPGPSALYFANISATTWWPSERPLLLVVIPTSNGPSITILTPKFEATRAKLLSIPAESNVSYIEWAEDESPYEVVANILLKGYDTLYLDDQTRLFVAEGLAKTAPDTKVLTAPKAIRSIRERKSPSEIELLRCANEATLLAIRLVRKQMKLGMYARDVKLMLGNALRSAGLETSDSPGLVLFGADAALPHGSGTDKTLSKDEFVLIDLGGTLHGYHGDITRTFALETSEIPSDHLVVWFAVQAAQRAAHSLAKNGTVASAVDFAARETLKVMRYGEFFTHRLGHGIGLETHESPYLRGGSEDVLAIGNTFSNEPGVYIEGKVGCRLEDVFVVSEDGSPEFLTSRIGGPASNPWSP